jgi:UDP-glucuronate decarboxylase
LLRKSNRNDKQLSMVAGTSDPPELRHRAVTGASNRPPPDQSAGIITSLNNNSRAPHAHAYGHPRRSFFSRENVVVLIAGVAIGYLILPFVMVQYIGFEDIYTTVGTTTTKKPLEQQSTGLMRGGGGRNAVETMETTSTSAASLFDAQFEFLASQSISTTATPHTMKTKPLPDSKRKRILVTGGAGFVGSHLVDKLMMEGHEVVVMDNLFTGSKKNVEHWMHHPLFSLIIHDVINPIMLEVDQIYHLACPASPPHYQYNPVKTIKTSTMGTLNMLGLAKRVKARVLLASTSEVYGDPTVHPQHESYWGNVNTVGPRSCYDEGKRVAETMMYSYRDQSNVEVRTARIFNTFGPRMHPNDGRVVSNFIIQSLQNRDITIYGDGTQTRSFQYVSDLVDGLYALMNGDYDMPVNIGNPDEYSVKQFAEYIKVLTESESNVQFLPAVQDDPSQRKPDISTAKRELGWEPKVKVKDGLAKTIAYFRKVLEETGEIIPTGPGAVKPVA